MNPFKRLFGKNREEAVPDSNDTENKDTQKAVEDYNYLQQQIEIAEKNGQPVEKYVMQQIDLLKKDHDEFIARVQEEGYSLQNLNVGANEIQQYSSMKALAEKTGLPVKEYDELIRTVRVRILGEEVVQELFDRSENIRFAYNEFMQKAVETLKSAKTYNEANAFLINSSKQGNGFKQIRGVLFKHEDFAIQHMLTKYGQEYDINLRLLKELKLKIVPQHIETIIKGNEMYVITKVPGTKNSELTELWKGGYERVSKEALRDAYRDLQKLTEADYVDAKILRSHERWFYAPDNNTVLLPVWDCLRKIQPEESKDKILEKFHRILFKGY
jgi:hypothetical protein